MKKMIAVLLVALISLSAAPVAQLESATPVVAPVIANAVTVLPACAVCSSYEDPPNTWEHSFATSGQADECDTPGEIAENEQCRWCDSNGNCHTFLVENTCDYADEVGPIHDRCNQPPPEAEATQLQARLLIQNEDFKGIAKLLSTVRAPITWNAERRALQTVNLCGRVFWQTTLTERDAGRLETALRTE